jgi:ribosomal protein L7/L12
MKRTTSGNSPPEVRQAIVILPAMGLFTPSSNERRLRIIERKLDAIMAHLGIAQASDDDIAEVRQLAANGRKIEAIKLYRQQTGCGLAEAKAFVDAL